MFEISKKETDNAKYFFEFINKCLKVSLFYDNSLIIIEYD